MEAHAEQSRLEEVTEAAVRIALHVRREDGALINQIKVEHHRAALASHHGRLFADRIRVREK